MEMRFLLILSSCGLKDCQESEKIKEIAYQLDRLYCLLQLQNSYSSYTFTSPIYKLSSRIREEDVSLIMDEFDKVLIGLLKSETGSDNIGKSLNLYLFKKAGLGSGNKNFIRYFLARIEKFIADNTNMGLKHSIDTLVRGKFHIEHILAHNDANLKLFGGDEDRFNTERNRLGSLLLLKGKDNSSSNNETFKSKLSSYANTLYWNETLRADSYKSKRDFINWIDKTHLQFKPLTEFGPEQLEERHRLLYEMVKLIWK
jgi:hypothetical protein